ncbi:MAG: 30S ribosomal protein S20, partial [Candidatus Electrothrix sp. AUS1_2]|nr:30S ribosomal protein S20 [Candidatus Electrothrix sp. AUS1_2]
VWGGLAGAEDAAQEALKIAIPVIQQTAGKGAIHKKKASRKISRLTGRVNRMMPIA